MQFYDVKDLATALAESGKFHKLSKKLARLISLRSIAFDLKLCATAHDYLHTLASERSRQGSTSLTDEETIVDASLATFLIISYSRSTDVSSPRGRFDPRQYFDDELLQWHKEIIALRNQAVAHFGVGSHSDGPWAGDQVVIALSEGGRIEGFLDFQERVNYRAKVIVHLSELIQVCLFGIATDIEILEGQIVSEMSADPDILRLIRNLGEVTPRQPRSHFRPRNIMIDDDGNVSIEP